jgi:hypothetical protein
MKLLEEQYHTPVGYRDFPFAYVYDATALTDGNNYIDIQVSTQGDSDFILRHIAGIDTVVNTAALGGRWNYKGHSRQYAAGNQSTGIVPFPNWPVVPEKWFRYNEAIWIDLFDVQRSVNACGGTPIPYSFIAFFGVKRFKDDSGYRTQKTPYKYREYPQRYEYSLTVDWAAFASGTTPNPPHRFSQLMDNYDFELLRISISSLNATGALASEDFALTLYDPNMHQLSNLPLPQGFFNAAKPTASTQPPYQGCFPVPSIVYPAGSAITFDVTSLLCGSSLPQTYNISFEGVWRLPCS